MAGLDYDAHAMNHTYRPIISFVTSARYLTRRYNQSAELARLLAASDDFVSDILLRHQHNTGQAGLSRIQRQKNVVGIFIVKPNSRANLFDKLVLVIR